MTFAADPAALDAAFRTLAKIEYGQNRAPLQPIEEAVAAVQADAALRRQLEQRFIRLLQSDAPNAAKDFACRSLKLVGSAAAVPALAALLPQPELSGLARYALEAIPDPAVDQALRAALPKLSGKLKIGVVTTLGYRRDGAAVPALTALLQTPDAAVARAAAHALAAIATPEAGRALLAFQDQATEMLRSVASQAGIEAADHLLQADQRELAARLFEQVYQQNSFGYLHLAAFQGLVLAQPDQATGRLIEALAGNDEAKRNLAGRLIAELPGREVPQGLLDALPNLPSAGQGVLLGAVGTRGSSAARSAVVPLLGSPNEDVRLAALNTLSQVGNAADVAALAQLAAGGKGAERDAARQSLARLPAKDVNAAIVAALPAATTPMRVELLRGLSARGARDQADVAIQYLADSNRDVSRAAVEALGMLGAARHVPVLVNRVMAASAASERELAAEALITLCSRVRERATDGLLNGLSSADAASRAVLLRVLGHVGDARALAAVRAAAKDPDAQVKDAAVRALTDWTDVAAAPDLLPIAQQSEVPTHRVLALRGYVRLARTADIRPEERLQMLTQAMATARDANDRRLVLGALGELRTIGSLRLVVRSLADAELADEAGAAVIRITGGLENIHAQEGMAALQRAIKSARAESVRKEAGSQLRRMGGKF